MSTESISMNETSEKNKIVSTGTIFPEKNSVWPSSKSQQMFFISDILKMNHSGIDIYAHVFPTGDKTRNNKYNWHRLIVYDQDNNELGIYRGIQMLSNRTKNYYYKFINQNIVNKNIVNKNNSV